MLCCWPPYVNPKPPNPNSNESWHWKLVAKNLLPFFEEFESLSSFCRHFVLGTFLGLIPASVVAVKAGRILSQINSMADLYDHKTILTISVIAILVLLPVIFKRQIEQQPEPILTKTTEVSGSMCFLTVTLQAVAVKPARSKSSDIYKSKHVCS